MALTTPEILRRLVRRFGLLLVLTLIGGIAGAVYGAVKSPTYSAKAYVVAVGDPGESITALNFAQAYGRIATSGPVLVKAGATLGADRRGLRQVTASTSPDAPVIEVTAAGTNATRTAAVANAVASALVDYGSARRTETHVTLALLAAAAIPTSPMSPRPPMELAVGAAGGLLVGGLAVLAGVGRPVGAPKRTDRAPTRYEVETFDEPEPTPAAEPTGLPTEIAAYPETAAPEYPPKAITAYRESAAPSYEALSYSAPSYEAPSYAATENEVGDGEEPAVVVPGERVIGRAVVYRAGWVDDTWTEDE
jgi:capsular polysaccharide biosynthesis protein